MAKSYSFLQEKPPEQDVEQRTVVATEKTYIKDGDKYVEDETKEEKFTIAQKEEELANIDRQIADLQASREEKVAEIAEIKTALSLV